MKNKNYNTEEFVKVKLSELPLYEFIGSQEDRWRATNRVIDNILNQHKSRLGSLKILDLALGGGRDSIFLIKRGYDVTSNPNYLLDKDSRIKSLQNFWTVLKKSGTLIFDSRNFDYMVKSKNSILKDPETNFKYLGKTTFLNKELIHGFPVEITNDVVRFVWKHYSKKVYAEMELWPATTENVKKLIQDSIRNVRYEILYDYQKQKPEHYDFVQYLLYKD